MRSPEKPYFAEESHETVGLFHAYTPHKMNNTHPDKPILKSYYKLMCHS